MRTNGVCSFVRVARALRITLGVVFVLANILPSTANAQSQLCATPNKDGAGGTLTGIVNTYFPGSGTPAAGATSITLGAATGANVAIATGGLLLVIQMQGGQINSTNGKSYGGGKGGVAGGGYTAATKTGLYEYVKANGAVSTAGGTLSLVGAGTGSGLVNSYATAAATGTRGRRTYQVVRVPQYSSATLSSGLTALAWNGSTGGILVLDIT